MAFMVILAFGEARLRAEMEYYIEEIDGEGIVCAYEFKWSSSAKSKFPASFYRERINPLKPILFIGIIFGNGSRIIHIDKSPHPPK